MAGRAVGQIRFGVSMDTAKLSRDVKKSQSLISRFVSGVTRTMLNFKTVMLGVGAALAAAFGAKKIVDGVKSQFAEVDNLAKNAAKLNVTTEALAGLRLAANEAGVESSTLDKALTKLVRNTADAVKGIGTAKDAYETLGLSAAKLNRMSPDQQFMEIANALSKVTNKQDQLSIATDLFGSRASMLINVLRAGRPALEEAAQAADDLGLTVSASAAKGVERAMDAFERFQSVATGIFRSIAIEIAPYIEALSTKIVNFVRVGGKGKALGKSLASYMVKIFGGIADTMQYAAGALTEMAGQGIFAFNQIKQWLYATAGIGEGMSSEMDLNAGRLMNRGNALMNPNNMPSSSINEMAQQFAAEAKAQAKLPDEIKKTPAYDALMGFADKLKGTAEKFASTPMQIVDGVVNGAIPKMQRSLLGTALTGAIDKAKAAAVAGKAANKKYTSGGGFSAIESGSAAAYEQRVRGKQQFDKVAIDQLAQLKIIAANTANQPQLAAAGIA
jgi:hypothetical protein